MIGQVLGSYRVLSELGRGSMGSVMLAEHVHLGRRAAIKVLHPNLCANAEAVQRFLVEARATAGIQHPGIVRIYDCGILADGIAFIIMELIEGETLRASLNRRGSWPISEAVTTVIQIADALAAAHRVGIVHRNLRPDDIFLLSADGGRVKLVDFGIAKLAERDFGVKAPSGTILGVPGSKSWEQGQRSAEVDYRGDIYSLGCVLFETLTGQPVLPRTPFVSQPPDPRIYCPDLPEDLATLILAMLAENPESRPSLAEIGGVLACHASNLASDQRSGQFLPRQAPTQILQDGQWPSVSDGAQASSRAGEKGVSPRLTTPLASNLSDSGKTVLLPQPDADTPSGFRKRPAFDAPVTTDRVPRRRFPWEFVAVAAGGVALIVIALLVFLPHRSAPTTARSPAPAPASPSATLPALPPRPAEYEPAQPAAPASAQTAIPSVVRPQSKAPSRRQEAVPAGQDAKISLMLTSVPSEALICSGAERIGITGTAVPLHRTGKKQTLTLYKSGYRQESITLIADRDVSRSVTLRPQLLDDLREPPPCR
jgi:serine/threonine protein kinase